MNRRAAFARTRELVLLIGAPLVAALAAIGAIELLLSPSAAARPDILFLVGVPAVGAVVACLVFRRWIARATRLATVVIALVVTGSALVVTSVSLAASRMFLNPHDAKLVSVVVVLAAVLSTLLTIQVIRPLAAQVRTLGAVAQRVAAGDLDGRTGIVRHDELGEAARAVDHMVARLALAEDGRRRLEGERRFLLSSIGHDLRTPLAALRATVESLQDGVAPDPARYLASMGTQLDAVETLIDDLTVYARIEAGQFRFEPTEFDLAELVDGTVEAMIPVAHRRGLTLASHSSGRAITIGGAPELARVLRNLIDNALRYGPVGSCVSVELVAGLHTARLTVRDDGPGFPADFRPVAFEPFTRADPARDRATGTAGLGLAIARGIVDAHGGTIAIGTDSIVEPQNASNAGLPSSSAPGGAGGCIEIHLPLRSPPPSSRRPRPSRSVSE